MSEPESDSHNIQNEFFNEARKTKGRVSVFLTSGKRLVGRIKSFDRFTLILAEGGSEQIGFKHAIATVSLGVRREHFEGSGGEHRQASAPSSRPLAPAPAPGASGPKR